ncbi:crotonobetaine/carnitine-CoA ligase [Nocardia amikacinitolerans]|uniref:Crotonobetaine/carnitine-CoA ligase n=1 Tax=Nocardia amikacinitolerans TaxID=756689 RepID=A0A285LYI9_9NOCA|nr:AMP-binding protein [Nocardia amikacinitolerans]MCP2274462.1 crotonobetaine/carnitine-CoA ligase [Nocardia amikacinitolerans]MCP2297200.1 crotonobetaine/carnitine-CoA ligase [Nocardia amikacinitolerans]SNY88391.1 crotonobetaine/carnitine-CoA ligase [Nocardia amikacinitolerans]
MTASTLHRTLGATITRAATTWPDRIAVRSNGEGITFEQLHHTALQYLHQLQTLALEPGDSVLIMLDNDATVPAVSIGAALGGIVTVPINTEYRGETLRHILAHSGGAAIVTSRRFLHRILEVRPDTVDTIILVDADVAAPAEKGVRPLSLGALGHPVQRTELDELAIMYTSGTTGRAKGGVVSERHAFEYAHRVAEILELDSDDVYYAPLPLFHIAGLWAALYACLQRGATCVLVPRFSVSRFWSDCREVSATKTFLLGAMAQFLHRAPDDPAAQGNNLRRMIIVPLIDDLDGFRRRFDVEVTTCYASTEVNVPLAAPIGASVSTAGGVGRPNEGFSVRVVREDGTDAAVGEPGELWVRHHDAGVLLLRYHDDPDATADLIVGEWHHSGDTFKVDEHGNYHFVDRLKDALRKRGENISSFEVESEVRAHPQVIECAVVGVASGDTEQEVYAYVQLRPGAATTATEIKEFVASRAPKFMVPDRVHFVATFPTTPTGKIQKFKLREHASGSVQSPAGLQSSGA